MEFALPVFYFLLFVVAIWHFSFFQEKQVKKYIFPLLFLTKIIAAIALVLIYTYYYTDRKTADVYKFFDDSVLLFDVFSTHPSHFFKLLFGIDSSNSTFLAHTSQMQFWNNPNQNELYNDSRLMIKINALLHFISFGYYGVHLVIFTFFSFVGFVAIYKAFHRFFEPKKGLIATIFLVPSFILWSSGILKESVLFLSLGLLLYAFFEILHQHFTIKNSILFCLSFLTLIYIKPYVLGFVLPAIISYGLANKFPLKKAYFFYLGIYGAMLIFGFSIKFLQPNYNALEIIATKQNNFVNVARGGVYLHDGKKEVYIADNHRSFLLIINDTSCKIKPNSQYEYRLRGSKNFVAVAKSEPDETIYRITFDAPPSGSLLGVKKLEPNLISFLKALPIAFINVLFKPFLFASFSPFLLMNGLENTLLLFFALMVIVYKKQASQLNKNLAWFCFVIAFSILIFVGLTTPVMGAMVRYKIPGLLFLIIGLLCLFDSEKLILNKSHK